MKISIAMATYNGARFLQEQLDSFVKQNLLPDELVVCDDGSSDSTYEILEAFRVHAPFPVVLYKNNNNLGYTRNFEKVIALCSGDVIFLSDQDDVWFPDKIEEVVRVFTEKNDVFVVQVDMIITDHDMNPSAVTQLENTVSLGGNTDDYMTGCGMALRRSWLQLTLPIPDGISGHDLWISRISISLGVRQLLDRPLQYYRRHENNASQSVASTAKKLSQVDSFLMHGLSDATKGWSKELYYFEEIYLRLSQGHSTLTRLGLAEEKESALSSIACRVKSLRQRIKNVKLSRPKRFVGVISMALHGHYRHFSGWKSVAKDILRP